MRCALTPGADVATGRWNGVLIAVKVVEHTGEHEGGRPGIVEGARESLLAASVSHPNVIPCYKVQPAQHSTTRDCHTTRAIIDSILATNGLQLRCAAWHEPVARHVHALNHPFTPSFKGMGCWRRHGHVWHTSAAMLAVHDELTV